MTKPRVDFTPELTHTDIERVLQSVEIPACPAMLFEVMGESQKDAPDIRRLTKHISNDLGLSAATIKLANSPLFRSAEPVSSVRKAVERLGIQNIVCVVVGTALRNTMTGLSSDFVDRFWSRTSVLAVSAAMVARRQYGVSPDAAYTYAMFHDAGIPLLMKRFPEYAQVVSQCQKLGQLMIGAEADYFPCTHPIVGSLLTRNWGLPASVGQAIRFHHDPDAYELPDSTLPGNSVSLIAITHLAEHILSEVSGEQDLEVGDVLFEKALTHFGISGEDVDQLRESIALVVDDAKH